ncbi:hypothetical protein [Streptomyces mirabilis]|uniref:hypothetical protein n=1 Tax=Streptomyces mirabilis TaxID=68239 RepID=UPI00365D8084
MCGTFRNPRCPGSWVARNLVRELRPWDSHQYAVTVEEAQRIGSGARGDVGDVAADVHGAEGGRH